MAHHVPILNDSDLNLLGAREPGMYGQTTLAELGECCAVVAAKLGMTVNFRQSNSESQLIEWVHEAARRFRRS